MIDFTVPEKLYLMPGFGNTQEAFHRKTLFIQSTTVFKRNQTAAYLFCNKSKNRMRILYWDGEYFMDIVYRLESGSLKWPTTEPKFMEISLNQISRLLQGDSMDPTVRAPCLF